MVADDDEVSYAAYEQAAEVVSAIEEAESELDGHLAGHDWEQSRAIIGTFLALVERAEKACAELLDARVPNEDSAGREPLQSRLPAFAPVDASLFPAAAEEGDHPDSAQIADEALHDACSHLRELARIVSDEASEALAAAGGGRRSLSMARFARARLAVEQCDRDYALYELMLHQVGQVTGSYPGVAGLAVELAEGAIRDRVVERKLREILDAERPA